MQPIFGEIYFINFIVMQHIQQIWTQREQDSK